MITRGFSMALSGKKANLVTMVPFISLPSSFFVVEDTVLHTTQGLMKTGSREVGDEGLVTQVIVNEFWTMAQDEALAVLRSNCVRFCSIICLLLQLYTILQSSCADYYLLLKVKQLVVWFCSTLRVSISTCMEYTYIHHVCL